MSPWYKRQHERKKNHHKTRKPKFTCTSWRGRLAWWDVEIKLKRDR